MTTPVLDFGRLVAPLPGADPAGVNPSTLAERSSYRKTREEAIESGGSLPLSDPAVVRLWRELLKVGQDVLSGRSKALEWAVRVVEAATRAEGFAGARDGFALLRRLAEDGWDRVWPKIDLSEADQEEDPEYRDARRRELLAEALQSRATQFEWLNDAGGGGRYPNAIRQLVIAESDGVALTATDCRPVEGRAPKIGTDVILSVANRLGPDAVRAAAGAIEEVLAELTALTKVLEDRFTAAGGGNEAPTFREVRAALEECKQVAEEMVGTEAGPAAAEPRPAGEGGGSDPKGPVTRDSLYRQLTQVADHLARIEPHSPVPLLLRRVVELQNLPFPDLVRQLNMDERVLNFLERSLTARDNS